MVRRALVALAIGCALGAAALVQDEMPWDALARRVELDASQPTPTTSDCSMAGSLAESGNAEALFKAMYICFAAGSDDDAIFLVLAGQARAMTDMTLLIDPAETPPPEVIGLYGYIYGTAGGAGPSAFYRNSAKTDALFARLRAWEAQRPPGYSPGWAGDVVAPEELYQETLRQALEGRIRQLSSLALLLRDDDYWRLQQELESLMAANDNTFHQGTPAQTRFAEIQAQQDAVRERLGLALF